jgi:thymidylate synthase (FAD)
VRVIQPSFEIIDHNDLLRNIELGGRVCYKSEDKMCPGSDEALISRLMNMKHESVLEHGVITVKFVTDRGVSHELVRHRLAAYSQESTRYCNYGKEKFGNEITVIDPFGAFPNSSPECRVVWQIGMNFAEETYFAMLEAGASPQEARSVLPNSTKTEVQMTANVREWRHVLRLRTHRDAHPQIRQIMIPLGDEFAKRWPVLFGDFAVQRETKNDD